MSYYQNYQNSQKSFDSFDSNQSFCYYYQLSFPPLRG
jgi:hypothetical protein